MIVSPRVTDMHARFCGALQHRYFIRVHMSVMLSLVLLSGLLGGRLLLRAGVTNMGLRYPLTVLLSYGVFLGLIWLWLAYVCRTPGRRLASDSSSSGSGDSAAGDWLDGGSGGSGTSGSFAGGGGGSGGGGSSGSWGEAVEAPAPRSAFPLSLKSGGGGSGASGGSGGGGGGDGDGLLLLLLFALLVIAVFGAGAYVIYQAPAILSEAAFQTALAGGLVKVARGAQSPGWMGSVLRSTAIPFALVLILSGVFGYQAHKHCPGAATVKQVFRNCVLG